MLAKSAFSNIPRPNITFRLSTQTRVVLIAAILSVSMGLQLSVNENRFLGAQVAYAMPTAIALLTIGIYFWRKGFLGLLNPTIFVMVGFLFFFSSAPFVNPTNSKWAVEIYSSPDRFLPLAGLYLLGIVSFLIGVLLAHRFIFPFKNEIWFKFKININRLWRLYLALILITIMCVSIVLFLNRLNPIDFFLSSRYVGGHINLSHPLSRYFDQLFGYLIIALGALSGIIFASSSLWKRRTVAFAVVFLCSLYLFSTGVRSRFLYLVGATVLVWWSLSWEGNIKKIKVTPRLIWTALFLILFVSQMIVIRNTRGGLMNYLSRGPQFISLRTFVDYAIDQNISLEQILDAVPHQRPHVGGMSFISPFVAFVPRQLWSGKPTTAWAYMRGYTIFAESPNASFSLLGELYMNFGLLGVPIGMTLFGFWTQRWYQLYNRNRQFIPMNTLYYMSLPAFAFLVRGDFQAAITPIFYPGLVVLFVLRSSRSKYSPIG